MVSDDQILSWLTWFVFLALFAIAVRSAIRHPGGTSYNLVLLFAMPATIILIGVLAGFGLVQPGPIPNAINTALLLAIAHLMLRLVDDFTGAPAWLLRASGAVFGLLAIGGFIFPPPRPAWFVLAQLSYFFGLQLYAAFAFVRAALGASGVTRRRLRTVALGSLLLGTAVIARALVPFGAGWRLIFELAALGSGVCYLLGFAPPLYLRRSWQEPELRSFLSITNGLSQLARPSGDLSELERAAAATLGTPRALIGLWNEARRQIRFNSNGQEVWWSPDQLTATGQAFLLQQPRFSTYRAGHDGDAVAPQLGEWPRAVLAAPISSSGRSFGVLAVSTPHAPVIGAEDIDLVALLAGQIGAMLAARVLAEELAQARSAQMKDDFLSAAAHDLQTPLTSVIGQAQLLERRMRADPAAAAYLPGVALIGQEAGRLRRAVYELLDAASAERGQLIASRERVDLATLAREAAGRYSSSRHPCTVKGDAPLVGSYDRQRVRQLIEHLLDNAVLYSPAGGPVTIRLRPAGGLAVLSVSDQGIGIPPDDLPQLFSRFFRGSNVDDRRYAGMGLSLFICRAIAEQHGGTITATSQLNAGSTFTLKLPLATHEEAPHEHT